MVEIYLIGLDSLNFAKSPAGIGIVALVISVVNNSNGKATIACTCEVSLLDLNKALSFCCQVPAK